MQCLFLVALAATALSAPQLHRGGCMSTGKKSSVVIPVSGADAGFTIIISPGTTTTELEASARTLPSHASFSSFTSARRGLYKKTSSSTIASTSTDSNLSASEPDLLDEIELPFNEFKQLWINLRLFLTSLRSDLFQFRMYYTSICKLTMKNKRSMLVYLGMCNSTFKKYHPKTIRNAFGSAADIEDAYADVKEQFHAAIEIASKHLHMGRMVRPIGGYNMLFAYPESDLTPILGLNNPQCPPCAANAKRIGNTPERHKNFDPNETTFDDDCPDCRYSFLKQMYRESPRLLNHLGELIELSSTIATGLHCIYPKTRCCLTPTS